MVSYWNKVGQTSNRPAVDHCQKLQTVNSSLNINSRAWLTFVCNESIWLLWYLHLCWLWHYISTVNIMRETTLVKQFFINLTSLNRVIMNILSRQHSRLPVSEMWLPVCLEPLPVNSPTGSLECHHHKHDLAVKQGKTSNMINNSTRAVW